MYINIDFFKYLLKKITITDYKYSVLIKKLNSFLSKNAITISI